MAVVYRHIRLDKNEPFYIGIGKTERRAISEKNRNKYWKNIVSKTNYEVEILFDDLSWDKACEKEKEFIKLYGRYDLGNGCLVNMTDGGDGLHGFKHSEQTKKHYSIVRKGMKHTQETKLKMSQSQIGVKRTEEHKLKTSIARKLNNGMKGKKPWNYGLTGLQKASEETKLKMREAWIKRKQKIV